MYRKSLTLGLILGLLLTASAAGPTRTYVDLNGWDWIGWSGDRKSGWICGWSMAMWYVTVAINAKDFDKLVELTSAQKVGMREGLEILDDYYAVPANRSVPLMPALYRDGPFTGTYSQTVTPID